MILTEEFASWEAIFQVLSLHSVILQNFIQHTSKDCNERIVRGVHS